MTRTVWVGYQKYLIASGGLFNKDVMMNLIKSLLICFIILFSPVSFSERIKDISSVAGVRDNQLIGYGLVVGLDGTGDQTSQTPFTVQSLKSMLSEFGVSLPANLNLQVKNIAAVTVHATLPAFAKEGKRLDVTVSSIGNAKSLRGGTLLMTPLLGVDNNIYAMAQGSLLVGGLGVGSQDGSRTTISVLSVGRVPNGAIIEKASPTPFGNDGYIILNLNNPDFTTAHRLAESINSAMGEGTAMPIDSASVKVLAPLSRSQRVMYLSMIENLTLEPGKAAAKVIINSRTGTVVIGSHVRVTAAAVTHGNLSVTITEQREVAQSGGALSGGNTVVVPAADIGLVQQDNRMFLFDPGTSLSDIVQAVNNIGAAPGDLVAIIEALKEAGALRAELIVI